MLRTILLTLGLICISAASFAQIDLYSRINDPKTLCIIDSVDSSPQFYATGNVHPPQSDSTDGYAILASDSGTGVITHFWMTMPISSVDTAIVKLYVDDSLIRAEKLYSFFDSSFGLCRAPFIRRIPDANLCDLQISYTKNFRITVERVPIQVWYAVGWRKLPITYSFDPFTTDVTVKGFQEQAEASITGNNNPWGAQPFTEKSFSTPLDASVKAEIFSLTGPGVIHSLKFSFDSYPPEILDSIWLEITWDNSPNPSVLVPLNNFFCIPPDTFNVVSYPIRVDKDSGLYCYFPMPFFTSAKISLINKSSQGVSVSARCTFNAEAVDRTKEAYFFAKFSETQKTRYGVFHPVLHEIGTGRLVGLTLAIPNNSHPVSLEGDPIIEIDSSERNIIHYTGTEDYFDGGFYFSFKTFSFPFCGHPQLFQKCYRFHILDPIDFKEEIHFRFQHGGNNDVNEHYRTCAYYYKLWTRFWVSRDSIRGGEDWTVSGSGYEPGEPITGKWNGQDEIFSTIANSNGEFSITMPVSQSWKTGKHFLTVNNEERPKPVFILKEPSILVIADFLPPVVRFGDTLLVTGVGFRDGEKVLLYLDSILVSKSLAIVGNDFRFFAVAAIPNISDDWKYHLVAIGDKGSRAVYADPVVIDRTLKIEFEDIASTAERDTQIGWCIHRNMSAFWYTRWSKQAIAEYNPTDTGHYVTFNFSLPVLDTFDIKLILSKGSSFGNFSYSLDGKDHGQYSGYSTLDWQPSDTISIGIIPFTTHDHSIIFRSTGKDSAADNVLLGADVLILKPITKLPLPEGAWDTTSQNADVDSGETVSRHPFLYPNPVIGGKMYLNFDSLDFETATIEVVDLLGRTMLKKTIHDKTVTLPLSSLGILPGSYLLYCTILGSTGVRHITEPFIVLQ